MSDESTYTTLLFIGVGVALTIGAVIAIDIIRDRLYTIGLLDEDDYCEKCLRGD